MVVYLQKVASADKCAPDSGRSISPQRDEPVPPAMSSRGKAACAQRQRWLTRSISRDTGRANHLFTENSEAGPNYALRPFLALISSNRALIFCSRSSA
jgi:hypothetical protein